MFVVSKLCCTEGAVIYFRMQLWFKVFQHSQFVLLEVAKDTVELRQRAAAPTSNTHFECVTTDEQPQLVADLAKIISKKISAPVLNMFVMGTNGGEPVLRGMLLLPQRRLQQAIPPSVSVFPEEEGATPIAVLVADQESQKISPITPEGNEKWMKVYSELAELGEQLNGEMRLIVTTVGSRFEHAALSLPDRVSDSDIAGLRNIVAALHSIASECQVDREANTSCSSYYPPVPPTTPMTGYESRTYQPLEVGVDTAPTSLSGSASHPHTPPPSHESFGSKEAVMRKTFSVTDTTKNSRTGSPGGVPASAVYSIIMPSLLVQKDKALSSPTIDVPNQSRSCPPTPPCSPAHYDGSQVEHSALDLAPTWNATIELHFTGTQNNEEFWVPFTITKYILIPSTEDSSYLSLTNYVVRFVRGIAAALLSSHKVSIVCQKKFSEGVELAPRLLQLSRVEYRDPDFDEFVLCTRRTVSMMFHATDIRVVANLQVEVISQPQTPANLESPVAPPDDNSAGFRHE